MLADDPKEAYFNGTSYLRLLNPMPVWGHSALSLRTCLGKYTIIFISRVSREFMQHFNYIVKSILVHGLVYFSKHCRFKNFVEMAKVMVVLNQTE